MSANAMMEITVREYAHLMDSARFLQCLEAAGVDNWEGYDYACEMHAELEEEAVNEKSNY